MIEIKSDIPKLEFVNNPIIHQFELSNGVNDEKKSSVSFEFGSHITDGAVVAFLNSKGVNRAFVFQDVITEPEFPTDRHILTFASAEETHIIPYYNHHIIPALRTISNIYKDYDVDVVFYLNKGKVTITAKALDEIYDFETNYTGTGKIEKQDAEERSNPKVKLVADVVVNHFVRFHGGDPYYVIFDKKLAGTLYAAVDDEGKSELHLSPTLQPFLDSYFSITKNETDFRNIVKVEVLLKEVNESDNTVLSENVYEFHCIKGGLKTPYSLSEKKSYWELNLETGKLPKLLSVTTNESRIPPLLLLIRSFVTLTENIGLFGITYRMLRLNDENEIIKDYWIPGDNTDMLEPLSVQYVTVDLREYMAIEILSNDASAPTPSPDENTLQKLIVDHTPYENQNFFFFFNSLGGIELAWFTGELKYSNKPNLSSFVSTNLIQSVAASPTQKFTVSTGVKSLNELSWMQEIIQSEMIYWLTKEEYEALYNDWVDNNVVNGDHIKYRIIKPVTNEITITPNADGHEFLFEFEVLNNSNQAVKL